MASQNGPSHGGNICSVLGEELQVDEKRELTTCGHITILPLVVRVKRRIDRLVLMRVDENVDDIDISTNLKPDEVCDALEKKKIYESNFQI